MSTKIEWCDETWNPVTGCTKVSAGCRNCFAERMAKRLKAMGQEKYRNGFEVTLHPDTLDAPLHWRKPRRVFVCSMSDLFHEAVPDEFISRVFAVLSLAHWHQFQVLTKRSDRMLALVNSVEFRDTLWEYEDQIRHGQAGIDWPLPNVHLGVSIEDNDHRYRLGYLHETPAARKFLSLEPLLGPLPGLNLSGIHWVIVGGESGPEARGCDLGWIRSVLRQCHEAGVPAFCKQVGAHPYEKIDSLKPGYGNDPIGEALKLGSPPPLGWTEVVTSESRAFYRYHQLRNQKGADPAEWPEDLRVREQPR